MKPGLSQNIVRKILNPNRKHENGDVLYTDYNLAKRWYKMKRLVKGTLADITLITIGIISAGVWLERVFVE